ncbi:MAG: hypothetical protein HRT89_20700, partial [Lentisphaeria bacterium]|nr:hypothetical protein [Lentisphaeria bacterium]
TRGKKVVEILASPVRVNLRSRGKKLKVTSSKSVKINLLDQAHGEVLGESVVDEGLKISVRGKLEFDGFYRMQVTITPPARGVMIDSLDISVALTNEQAVLFNAGSDQMRSQKTFLDIEKKNDGVLWDSINAITVGKEQKLTAVKRNNPIWPHVWVGNDDRGIAMMVENTRSWLIDRNKPVMDLVRKEGVTTLRLILVNKPVLMNKSITADFSLQATPVRPRPAGGSWKKEEWYGWGYFDNAVIAHDIEPGSVTKETAEANPWYRTEEALQQNRWWKYGCMQTHRISQNDPVYGEMIRLTADEWSVGLYTPSHIDFLLWSYKKWHDKESMDGLYFDNTFPQSSSSLGSGLGWIDEKGKRQSSYNVFLQREFMKRLHHYLQSVGPLPVLKIHSTDCAAIGYMGFGDFWMDGENGGYTPHGEQVEHDKGKKVIDFVDRWYNPTGMTDLRIMLGKQWGVIHHYLYSWGFESTYAILGMFDLEKNYRAMGKKPFHEFGRFEKDIEFIPYWSNKKVGKWLENGEDIFVTAWKRAGKVRLLISNLSSEDRAVSFKVDLQALGLSNTAIVMDEREGSELDFTDSTLKKINIPRHDYTTLIIAKKGLYTPLPQNLGHKLSPPAKLWINEYCDNFSQLKSNWAKNASPNITKATVDHGVESPAFSIMSGYLRIRTSSYIYSNLKQKFNQDNCSVQIKVRDYVGKYAIGYGPGLHLYWGNGASVHLTVGPGIGLKSQVHRFHTWSMVNGKKVFEKYGDLIAKVNWLKIELNNEKICFYTSNDAKEWSPLSRHKRDAFIGAAQVLAVGHGEDKDVYLEGYSFDSFFKDLIVAKLKE